MPNQSVAAAPENSDANAGSEPVVSEQASNSATEAGDESSPAEGGGNRLSELMAQLNAGGTKKVPDEDDDEDEPQPGAETQTPQEAQQETSVDDDSSTQNNEGSESEATGAEGAEPGDSPESTTEGEGSEDELDTRRVRVGGKQWEGRELDLAVIRRAQRDRIGLDEARRKVLTEAGVDPDAKATSTAQNSAAVQEAKPTIESLREQVKTKSKEIAKATAELDEATVERLMNERDELAEKIQDLRLEARESERAKVTEHESKVGASLAQAIERLPDTVKVEGGLKPDFTAKVEAEMDRMSSVNPGFFDDPEWPLTVIAKVSLREGIGFKPAASARVVPKPAARVVPSAPKPGVRTPTPSPASGAATSSTAGAQAAKDAAFQKALADARKTGDPKKMRDVLNEYGDKSIRNDD